MYSSIFFCLTVAQTHNAGHSRHFKEMMRGNPSPTNAREGPEESSVSTATNLQHTVIKNQAKLTESRFGLQ